MDRRREERADKGAVKDAARACRRRRQGLRDHHERKEEKSLTKQLLKQRFEEHIGTISEPIFYGHALMDSIR